MITPSPTTFEFVSFSGTLPDVSPNSAGSYPPNVGRVTGPDQSVNPPEPNANSPARSINRLAGKAQQPSGPLPKPNPPLGRIKRFSLH